MYENRSVFEDIYTAISESSANITFYKCRIASCKTTLKSQNIGDIGEKYFVFFLQ